MTWPTDPRATEAQDAASEPNDYYDEVARVSELLGAFDGETGHESISSHVAAILDARAALRVELAALRVERAAEREEVKRLQGIIEHERSAAITWIGRTRAAVRSHSGMSESRGSYVWNDDEYRMEFRRALDDIDRALARAEHDTNARSWKDCPATQAEVDAARAATSETATNG